MVAVSFLQADPECGAMTVRAERRRGRVLLLGAVLCVCAMGAGCFGKSGSDGEKQGGPGPTPAPEKPEASAPAPEPEVPPAPPIPEPEAAPESEYAFVPLSRISIDDDLRRQIAALTDAGAAKRVMEVLFQDKARAIPALRKALRHRQRNVRIQAAQILVRARQVSDETTAAFVRMLLLDPDQEVRASLAKELRQYEAVALVEPLVKMLAEDDYGMARAHAAWALGAQGSRLAIPALAASLQDSETWVRLRSLNALRLLGARPAMPAIVELLKDPNKMVRDRALKTLQKISGKRYGADYDRWKRAVGR